MTPERRLEILINTRRLITSRRRWGKGRLMEHTIIDRLLRRPPSLCLMGAVMIGTTGQLDYSMEVYEALDFLADLIISNRSPYPRNKVTAYNDASTTTHEGVLFLVDTAIFHTQNEIAELAREIAELARETERV